MPMRDASSFFGNVARAVLAAAAILALGSLGACKRDLDESRSTSPHRAARVSPADFERVVDSLNTFGLDVWAALGAEEENSFFSPIGITVPLAALSGGARGQTAAELGAALHGSAPPEAFHSALNQVRSTLIGRTRPSAQVEGREAKLDLVLASSLWVQSGQAIEPQFLDLLASEYDMGVRRARFAEAPVESGAAINEWVSEHTSGKIQRLIDPQTLSDQSRFLLASTLYLDASWAAPFSPEHTSPRTFHAPSGDRTVAMMRRIGNYRAADLDGASAVELPYVGSKLALLVILPEPGAWSGARARLSSWLERAPAALQDQTVDLQLPRFQFDWGPRSLIPALKASGVRRALELGADFSGIAAEPKLILDDVVQSTRCAVTESGTVAAAASAANVAVSSAPTRTFVADRPFFIAVRDESGILAFLGQVLAPNPQ
jgi:serpin B